MNKHQTTKFLKTTKQQQQELDKFTSSKTFNCSFPKDNKKVIHQNHITSEFISSLCNNCNLKYKYKEFIPVYCHNVKGYDSHFLIVAF